VGVCGRIENRSIVARRPPCGIGGPADPLREVAPVFVLLLGLPALSLTTGGVVLEFVLGTAAIHGLSHLL
jgi:hypothetical protein